MNNTPASCSGERVQKYVFNFEIYRSNLPHPLLCDAYCLARPGPARHHDVFEKLIDISPEPNARLISVQLQTA